MGYGASDCHNSEIQHTQDSSFNRAASIATKFGNMRIQSIRGYPLLTTAVRLAIL